MSVQTLTARPDSDLDGDWQILPPTPVAGDAYTEPVLLGSDATGYQAGDSNGAGDISEALTLPDIGSFGGAGTVSLVGFARYDGSSTFSTTHKVSYPSVSILAGDHIQIVTSTQESTVQSTGSTATGFTERWFRSQATAFRPALTLLWKTASGGESGLVTVTLPASVRMSATVIVWRGVDQTTPFDAAASAGVFGNDNPDPSSVTTVTDDAEVVVYAGAGKAGGLGAPTISTGYTLRSSPAGSGDRLVQVTSDAKVTAGAENPDAWTWDVDSSTLVTDSLRPAASSDVVAVIVVALADETATTELTTDDPVLAGATWDFEGSFEVSPTSAWRPQVHVWTANITSYSADALIDITVSSNAANHSWSASLFIFAGLDTASPVEALSADGTGYAASATWGAATPTTLGAKLLAFLAKTPSGWHYHTSPNHDGQATYPQAPAGYSPLATATSDAVVLECWLSPPLLDTVATNPPSVSWDGIEDWTTGGIVLTPDTAAGSASDLYSILRDPSKDTWVEMATAAGSMDEVVELDVSGVPADGVISSISITVEHASTSLNPLRVELVGIRSDDTRVLGGEIQVGYVPSGDGSASVISTGAWRELGDGSLLHEYERFGVRLFSTERAADLASHQVFSVAAEIGYVPGGPTVVSITEPATAGDAIGWVYGGESGLPQTKYQVMVIAGSSQDPEAATVANNPLAASAGEIVYDSGPTPGVLTRGLSIVDAPLGRGDNTVAVRSWARLPNGQEVASAWTTDNFNITGTEPTVPDQSGNTNPTLDVDSGAMVVTVDVPAAVSRAWLNRSDDGGVTYQPTMGSPFDVTASASDVELSDYWCPLASDQVRYQITFDDGPMTETGLPVVAGSSDVDRSTTITEWYAIVPDAPGLNMLVEVSGFRRSRLRRSTSITQRGNNLSASTGLLGSRIDLTVRLRDNEKRAAFEALLDRGAFRLVNILGQEWLVAVEGDESPELQRWMPLPAETTGLRDAHEHSVTLIEVGAL